MPSPDNSRYRRVCVTPIRNEQWIINSFLSAVRTWATDIIVAEQGSTDGTLETLRSTPGVDVVINDSAGYDENHRQKVLLDRARRIPGNRILIGLDADEALSANVMDSDEWRQLETAEPGTVLRFRWVNLLPGLQQAWIPPEPSAFGFIDDGSEHHGKRIHSPRLPQPQGAPVIDLQEIVVLHFQYLVWDRMISKHRWYQAWESLKRSEMGPLQIFRQYHHMFGSWGRDEIHPVRPEWLEGYRRRGIDFERLQTEQVTWWDSEVLQMLQQYGPDRLRKIDIWDKNWNTVAALVGIDNGHLADPRTVFEKLTHVLLRATQRHRANVAVRAFEAFLRRTGW